MYVREPKGKLLSANKGSVLLISLSILLLMLIITLSFFQLTFDHEKVVSNHHEYEKAYELSKSAIAWKINQFKSGNIADLESAADAFVGNSGSWPVDTSYNTGVDNNYAVTITVKCLGFFTNPEGGNWSAELNNPMDSYRFEIVAKAHIKDGSVGGNNSAIVKLVQGMNAI